MTSLRFLPVPEGAEDYAAIDKPAGRAVTGTGGILAEVRDLVGRQAALVHRLDKDTSGLLLIARTRDALRAAHRAWERDVSKVYVGRVRGAPPASEGLIEEPLLENRTGRPDLLARALRAAYGPARAGHLLAGRRVGAIPRLPRPRTTAVHPAGRPAATAYRLLRAEEDSALVELVPRQGRMHQLRVHLAYIGAPLLDDPLYDPAARPGHAMVLHALRIEWRDPPGRPAGETWVFEAPLER